MAAELTSKERLSRVTRVMQSKAEGRVKAGSRRGRLARRLVGTCLMGLVVLGAAANPAGAAFGIASVDGVVADSDGNVFTQAGGHPYSAGVSFEVNTVINQFGQPVPDGGAVRSVQVDLPPGLVGNPTAVPVCPKGLTIPATLQAVDPTVDANTFCPVNTIVGIAVVKFGSGTDVATWPAPVFSVQPPPGVPATFAFNYLGFRVFLDAKLRSDGDYGLSITARNLNQGAATIASTVTLWGVPADHSHDSQRCLAFLPFPDPVCTDLGGAFPPTMGPHSADVPLRAFLTTPTRCAAPGELVSRLHIDPWRPTSAPDEATFIAHDSLGTPVGVTGCEQLPFDPTIRVRPDSTKPDSPTGLQVDLTFPQDNIINPTGLVTANLRRATVTLPEGMTVSPSSANGLDGCSDAQVGIGTLNSPACPEASKIGTVTAETPLLKERLEGSVYVGTQKSSDPESGDMFRIFITLENKERGIVVKLPGKVRANASTGRLETTFDDNPQLPVSKISLRFKSGERAPLANPPTCGTHTVTTSLSSWGGQTAAPSDSFTIDCPGVNGFSPTFVAGVANPVGGAFSPLSVGIEREDQQQYLRGLTIQMPPGMIAKLKGVPLCAEEQAAAGTCPLETRIGTAAAGSGPGSEPFVITNGTVSLTGPYKGAPYGLSVAVRAVAGPFDLGTVVVRQAIFIDPTDARLTVVSDPIPTVVKGVPLRLRSIDVNVNRPGFTLNPTSCAAKQIRATMVSAEGSTSTATQRFQVGDCQRLAFTPKLGFRLGGSTQTKAGGHPSLKAVLTQRSGQADIKRVEVRLPLSLALDPANSTSSDLCEFADGQKAEPTCPKSSIIGSAKAWTPVLNKPISGPVFFVKNVRRNSAGRLIRTLPSLVIPLRGEVALNLRGDTAVKGNKLVNTFPIVPDAPVTRFELRLKGGKKGILTVTKSLCRGTQSATTLIDAHNGKRADRAVAMKTPCGHAKKAAKHTKR